MPRLVDQPLATSLLSHGLLADLAPAAAYAVESALCDLLGQAASQPVAALIGRMAHTRVPLNATLGVSTDEDSVREARRAVEAGFRCLKVKVDAGRLREEIRRLALVREAVGPDVGIRVDVNGSWTLDQAADACRRLEPLGIDYVEQPVATAAELAELRRRVRVRIAADESVTGPQAAAEIAAAGAADVVVVKPAWLGIAASRRIVDIATAAGLSIVVTSVLDTTIGIAAALHFAASVPGNLPPCGLATAGLLASDLAAEPPMVDRGEMLVPLSGGLGVTLDEAALGRWAESPG